MNSSTPGIFRVPIRQIKLLSPGNGWLEIADHLLITTSNGRHWQDITPIHHPEAPPQPADSLAAVFFLNPHSGWVLYEHFTDDEQGDSVTRYFLERTRDAGAHWVRLAWPVDGCAPPTGNSCSNGVEGPVFADQSHGWMALEYGSAAMGGGTILSTTDAGESWKPVNSGPDGHISEMTPAGVSALWLTSSDDSNLGLLRTDRMRYSEVQLPAATALSASSEVDLGPVIFESRAVGYVVGVYTSVMGDTSTAILYRTSDSGHSWRTDRVLSNVHGQLHSDIAGSAWLIPVWHEGETHPALLRLAPHQNASANAYGFGDLGRCRISFVSPETGWVECEDGLFSTTDGGTIWTEITPSRSDLAGR